MSDTSPFILYAGDPTLGASKVLRVDVGFGLVPDGGDLVLTAENMLGELQSLVGTGILCVTGTDTLMMRTITSSSLNVTNADGVSGNIGIEQKPSSAVQLINVLNNGVGIGGSIDTLDLISGTGGGVAITRVGNTAHCTFTSSFVNPMTAPGDLIIGGASGVPTRLPLGTNGQIPKSNGSTVVWSSDATGAPVDSTYIVQTATDKPTNAQVLASLATGIVKNTTTTGVLSIASPNGDYYGPTTLEASFETSVTSGGVTQSTWAFYAAGGGSGSYAMFNSAFPSVPVLNIGILSMTVDKVLRFTNNVANYAVPFGAAAVGSIPLGGGGSYSDLTIGANGTVLKSNGTTASWQADAGTTVTAGNVALSAGSSGTITLAGVTTTSKIVCNYSNYSGAHPLSNPGVLLATPGTGNFTITSTNALDASGVCYMVIL